MMMHDTTVNKEADRVHHKWLSSPSLLDQRDYRIKTQQVAVFSYLDVVGVEELMYASLVKRREAEQEKEAEKRQVEKETRSMQTDPLAQLQ